MSNPYDPRFRQSIGQYDAQFKQVLDHLSASSRIHDKRIEDMRQNLADLTESINHLSMARAGGGGGSPGVVRIEDIPGRRVPYTLLLDIPIGSDTTSRRSSSVTISQEGPFVAVRRMATFQSQYEFVTADPETGSQARLAGRSFGRFRPIHSAWDLLDSTHNGLSDAGQWYLAALNNTVPVGTDLPSGVLGLPSNLSSFRTMEFDARITVLNAGSSYPRQNISVPSSFWSSSINSPFNLGALDFFERGEVLTVEVQPTHVSNPPAGNVDGSAVIPATAGLAGATGWPFVEGQFDAHEGVATPGASEIDDDDPNLPKLLDTDSVSRLPNGILTIGWEGYRIIQPIGPVG
jgi:hypothetical protein